MHQWQRARKDSKIIEAKMATCNQQKQNEYNDHNEEQFQSDTQGARSAQSHIDS